MSKKRCPYCGKLITYDKTYCNIECKNKYEEFTKYTSKRAKSFGITIAIMIIMLFTGLILITINPHLGVIVTISAAIGTFGTMILFPFATPETTKLLGIKKSVLIVRIVALLMILWIMLPILLHKIQK